jgi:hypothetical protein
MWFHNTSPEGYTPTRVFKHHFRQYPCMSLTKNSKFSLSSGSHSQETLNPSHLWHGTKTKICNFSKSSHVLQAIHCMRESICDHLIQALHCHLCMFVILKVLQVHSHGINWIVIATWTQRKTRIMCQTLVHAHLQLFNIFSPYFTRPKHSGCRWLVDVLKIVPCDICFLQFRVKSTHQALWSSGCISFQSSSES